MRHFSDSVILLNYDLNLHIRNNIIKLQSLVHNQLSSQRYHSLFKYSWFKSGYNAEKQGEFENPVDFSFKTFSNTLCEISGCQTVAAIMVDVRGAKNLCVLNISSKSITTVPRTMNKQV